MLYIALLFFLIKTLIKKKKAINYLDKFHQNHLLILFYWQEHVSGTNLK